MAKSLYYDAVNFSSSPRSVQAQVGDCVNFTCDIANDPYLSRQFIQYSLDGRIFGIFANEPAVIIRYNFVESKNVLHYMY